MQTLHGADRGPLPPRPRPAIPWKIRAFDGTGFMTLVFFKGGEPAPAAPASGRRGAHRLRQGRAVRRRAADGPSGLHRRPPSGPSEIPEIEAIYPATAGLPSRTRAHASRWRRWSARRTCRNGRTPPGSPARRFPAWREALARLHNPQTRGRPLAASAAPPAPRLRRAVRPPAGHGPAQGRAPQASRPRRSRASDTGRAGRGRPALRPHRRPGPRADRDPRRPRRRRADEPAAAGRRGLRQDRGGHAGHGRRRRRRPASRR